MQSAATSVEAYLAELSSERRAIVSAVREVVYRATLARAAARRADTPPKRR